MNNPETDSFLISFIALFMTGTLIFLVMRMIIFAIRHRKDYSPINENSSVTEPRQEITSGLLYEGDKLNIPDDEIVRILTKYYPYYTHLQSSLQFQFKERLKKFMKEKTFVICSNEGYKEMPVLISAAAIQISFGLDKFMLPYFRYIKVQPEEYFANDTEHLRVLEGNVEGNIITIAWNHFLKGFDDYNDGQNVGLHEMAHALYFQYMQTDMIKEKNFNFHFNKIMLKGNEVYASKESKHVLFSDYAYRNLQEFWAESVEIFFERPEALRANYPDLYSDLKELLQQDPSNKINPLLDKV